MILRMKRDEQVRRDHYTNTGAWLPSDVEVEVDERLLSAADRRRLLELYRIRPGAQVLELRRPTTLGGEYRPSSAFVSTLEVAEIPAPEQVPAFLAAHLQDWESALARAEERERRRREEAEAAVRDREQAAARERQEKTEAEARLRSWAEAHGSELLRARAAEGFRWVRLARQEFADAVLAAVLEAVPGLERAGSGGDGRCLTAEERTTPTLEEIAQLRAVRGAIEQQHLPATATLVWMNYSGRDDDSDPDDCWARTELRIVVTTPDAAEVERFVVAVAAAAAAGVDGDD